MKRGKDKLVCGKCGKVVSHSCWDYQKPFALREHYQQNHPAELREMEEAQRLFKDTVRKHCGKEYNPFLI